MTRTLNGDDDPAARDNSSGSNATPLLAFIPVARLEGFGGLGYCHLACTILPALTGALLATATDAPNGVGVAVWNPGNLSSGTGTSSDDASDNAESLSGFRAPLVRPPPVSDSSANRDEAGGMVLSVALAWRQSGTANASASGSGPAGRGGRGLGRGHTGSGLGSGDAATASDSADTATCAEGRPTASSTGTDDSASDDLSRAVADDATVGGKSLLLLVGYEDGSLAAWDLGPNGTNPGKAAEGRAERERNGGLWQWSLVVWILCFGYQIVYDGALITLFYVSTTCERLSIMHFMWGISIVACGHLSL